MPKADRFWNWMWKELWKTHGRGRVLLGEIDVENFLLVGKEGRGRWRGGFGGIGEADFRGGGGGGILVWFWINFDFEVSV